MFRDRLDTLLERGILVIFLAIIGFGPIAYGAVKQQHFIIIQGLASGALFFWLIRLWLKPNGRALFTPTCWGVIAFLGFSLYSYFHADVEYQARLEVIKFFTYGALFFVALNNLHKTSYIKTITVALTLVGTFVAMYAVFQSLTGSTQIWSEIQPEQYKGRASGTYVCPNHMAGFLEMVCPLAIACAITGRRHILSRILYSYAALMMLAAIGLSVSRTGWAVTAVSIGLLLIIAIRRPVLRVAIIVIALSVGAFAYGKLRNNSVIQNRFEQTTTSSGKFADMRFHIWPATIQMWKDHFWKGVGPDQFDLQFPRYQPEDFYFRPDRVHNDYLNLLVDLGTIGFTIAAITAITTLWGFVRTWKSVDRTSGELGSKPGSKATYVLGTAIGMFALLAHALFDFNFHVPANAITFTILLAILSSHWRQATNSWWIKPRWYGCLLATMIALPILAVSSREITKRHAEATILTNRGAARSSGRELLTILKKAFEIEPSNYATAEEIGEILRLWSMQGDSGYAEKAIEAIEWFEHTTELNPHTYYSAVRIGMCLDWTQRYEEAEIWFQRAHELAPSNYFVITHLGWHELEKASDFGWKGNLRSKLSALDKAEEYFRESIRLSNIAQLQKNIAKEYLEQAIHLQIETRDDIQRATQFQL